MACTRKTLKMWRDVQGDSWLHLSVQPKVAGDPVTFASNASWEPADGSDENWPGTVLTPGPKRKKINAPGAYVIRVRVDFQGSERSSACVRAKIIKPDGTEHHKPYCGEVSGKAGDRIRRVTITIKTLGGRAA